MQRVFSRYPQRKHALAVNGHIAAMAVLASVSLAQSPPAATAPAELPFSSTSQPFEDPKIVAPKDPNTFLSTEELAQAFREKQYALVLREVLRIQNNKKTLATYNQYDLTSLKAESHLQLKNPDAALAAFRDLVKFSANEETKAVSLATSLLVQRRKGLNYEPKTPENPLPKPGEKIQPLQPISLLDLSQRPAALRALFRDETAAAMPAITQAYKGDSLIPIMKSARTLEDLQTLEFAATGLKSDTTKMQEEFSKRSLELMVQNLKTTSVTISRISQAANIETTYEQPIYLNHTVVGYETFRVKQGLSRQDQQKLKDLSDTLGKYAEAAKDLAEHLHTDPKTFEAALDDAEKLTEQATTVLKADYSIRSSEIHSFRQDWLTR